MKIYMLPDSMELGIGRVVSNYKRYLIELQGCQFVDNEEAADLVVMHAGEMCSRQADVVHNHGLYPTAQILTDDQFYQYNAKVIENLRVAKTLTVPSDWVAEQVRRNMLKDPTILPHGINPDEWEAKKDHSGYVVWAKGHKDRVCDPEPVNGLAEMMRDTQFVTTYGRPSDNVRVIGVQPYEKIPRLLSSAGVYLSTTRETFGIQLLEAMASGLPIVGWSHGAISDIVTHRANGWLCEPGDYEGLKEGIEWALANRDRIGQYNVRMASVYSWPNVVGMVHTLYENTLASDIEKDKPDVSVVITCYNREWCIADAIESVLKQEFSGEVEIIVVDDGSTDDSVKVIRNYSDRVKLVPLKYNCGAAMARNYGIRLASSDIIASLDSDDVYLPHHLKTLVPKLQEDRGAGITYGQLIVKDNRGERVADWTRPFSFVQQLRKQNHIPSASVFRKDAWERVRGYNPQYIRGEDSRLWLDITSIGYRAIYVREPVYVCNMHSESLTLQNELPDWVGDLPWKYDFNLIPFAAPADGYSKKSFPVWEYDPPWVSIIIPVGPGHEATVWRAVESVWKQSLPFWECVVVNDSGKDLVVSRTGTSLEDTFPFVKVVETHNPGSGAGAARNVGVANSQAKMIAFLDADDIMMQDYLKYAVQAWNDNPECYIYTNWWGDDGKGKDAGEFSVDRLLREAIHPITILLPKAWHNRVGGFDEDLPGWEDWDYVLKIVKLGHGGYHLAEPLVVYDYTTGSRREDSYANKDELLQTIRSRYRKEDMAGCKTCNKGKSRPKGVVTPRAKSPSIGRKAVAERSPEKVTKVLVRENSNNLGRHAVVGARTRINYGSKKHGDVFEMHIEDANAQPGLYVRVVEEQVARVSDIPTRPMAPDIPIVDEPVEVEDTSKKVEVVESLEDVIGILETEVADEDFELDIAVLPLDAIKRLGLDPETAFIALEEELYGRNRKTVIEYLKATAQTYMEEEGIEFEDLLEEL